MTKKACAAGTLLSVISSLSVNLALSVLSGFAAVLTTAANVPQVIKYVRTGSSDDLSQKMLVILSTGLLLWLAYGRLREDFIVAAAHGISLCLVTTLLGFKWRDVNRRP